MQEGVDIELAGVGFSYVVGERPQVILQDINLKVDRGSFCCILGPSGCGKTTLLRIVSGELQAFSGALYIDEGRVKSGFALIPQSAPLLPWRTVLQNVTIGLELKGSLLKGQLEHVQGLIDEYYLRGSENLRPGELSGGMKQRTAVIRALASNPALLFCDEPFSAVDFVTRLALITKFKKLCKLSRATVLFVTHNIEEAIFLGDEIVVLGGRPTSIISRHRPSLSIHPEDAVECRRSPEFEPLFRAIWKDLGARQV